MTSNCEIRFADESSPEVTYEFRICGTAIPYTPAKISGPPEDCYPEEGGSVEDLDITLLSIANADGCFSPTTEQKTQIEAAFEKRIAEDQKFRDNLEYRLAEDALNRCQSDDRSDELYQRWKDGDR